MFTLDYAEKRNIGIENRSDLTGYNYSTYANLSFSQGYNPQNSDFQPVNRKDKIIGIEEYKKNAPYD